MNDYDKAGRYLVKRDPQGFFRWLLDNASIGFHAWIDARRTALPNQGDLTNDLVAAVRSNGGLEAICVELEAQARADALPRLLGYLARLWTEPAGQNSLRLTCVSGAILDLTERSPAREISLRSAIAPACHLELTVLRRYLVDEDAAGLVANVAAGKGSPWLLAWVPLMQGGAEAGIIASWKSEAEHRLRDERDRADLGSLTLTLAGLAGCRPVWEHALRRWNMQTSPFLDEIRAQSREEGRVEGAQTLVLRQGRQKFGRSPTKKQQEHLQGLTDLARLEVLAERLLHADTWADLLNGL